jgi:hypothetical protein
MYELLMKAASLIDSAAHKLETDLVIQDSANQLKTAGFGNSQDAIRNFLADSGQDAESIKLATNLTRGIKEASLGKNIQFSEGETNFSAHLADYDSYMLNR